MTPKERAEQTSAPPEIQGFGRIIIPAEPTPEQSKPPAPLTPAYPEL